MNINKKRLVLAYISTYNSLTFKTWQWKRESLNSWQDDNYDNRGQVSDLISLLFLGDAVIRGVKGTLRV